MNYKHFFLLLALVTSSQALAQTGSVGIGTTSPASAAALEVQSTTQGVLLPRMTTTEMNNIAGPVPGMMIYNSTEEKFYGFAGAVSSIVQNSGGSTTGGTMRVAQSFTAVSTNTLVSIFAAVAAANTTLTLNVYSGNGTSGALLGTVSALSGANASTGTSFPLTALGISVTSTQVYTFEIVSSAGLSVQYSTSNPYAGGGFYMNGTSQPTSDLRFQVDVKDVPKWTPLH